MIDLTRCAYCGFDLAFAGGDQDIIANVDLTFGARMDARVVAKICLRCVEGRRRMAKIDSIIEAEQVNLWHAAGHVAVVDGEGKCA